MKDHTLEIAKQILHCPTGPFREHAVRDTIIAFCTARDMNVKTDAVGNVIATYGAQYKNAPIAFEAHMDHPGFIAAEDSARNRLTAYFYGGVENTYFKGSAVEFFTDKGSVRATVTKVDLDKLNRRRVCRLKSDGPVFKGDLGMWALKPCRIRGDKLYSRACDDLIGCVAMLSMIDQLHQRRIRKKVMLLFTVAEEVGFNGAKHLCIKKTIPKKTTLIAIETSSEIPGVKMGDGVIIRVGDARSIFTPAATDFLTGIAQQIKKGDPDFTYQRKLMDAGTCESTVYYQAGYTTAALCVALGNYHNRNRKKTAIEAEYVSIDDLKGMIRLFVAIVKSSNALSRKNKDAGEPFKRETGELGEFFYLPKA